MKKNIYILSILICLSLLSYSQQTIFDETKVLYTNEISFGGILHTSGWGFNFRKSKSITGFKKRFLEIAIVSMKHPKEFKTYNHYYENTKGYVFGKLNSLAILRYSLGKTKILYSKETKKGVEICYLYSGGISLGLVKPVYLEIGKPVPPPYQRIITERYNKNEHHLSNIYGRAPALKGIEEIGFYPGLHAKLGLNFEYASLDERIRAMETGMAVDLFYKDVPIMAFIDNKPLFFSLYINFLWGRKSY